MPFVLLWTFSCSDKNTEYPVIRPVQKAFVENYVYPKFGILDYSIDYEGNIAITINIAGIVYSQYSSEDSVIYWKYACQYGDTAYNSVKAPVPIACCTKLNSIDIICDKDFDDSHEALVSLSDITEYNSTSYRNYIQSGYINSDGSTWLIKNLSEMKDDDYLFLDADGSMTLKIKGSNRLPQGEYKFTIFFVTEDNEIVKSDLTVVK
jgi:hypothetical protein